MNICVVGLRGLPHVMGGVETHCAQLFPLLAKIRPNDSFTIIGRRAYLSSVISQYEGLWIVSLAHAGGKNLETITNTLYGVLYARFVLHADLVHLQGIGPGLLAPFAKALGMKVVVTYHSKNYQHRKWGRFARLMLRVGELSALTFADRVIAVSRSLATDLRRRFPRAAAKVHFIPNGANHIIKGAAAIVAREECLAKYGLTEGKYIIAVGRLVPEKGFHDLIAAFKGSVNGYKLVIVGDADHRDTYSESLRRESTEAVIFTGFVGHDTLRSLLESASLFVLPSYNEGLPIAALEAAVLRVPILLSDIEPNRDLGLEARNYFKVGNVDDLKNKLAEDHCRYRVDPERLLQQYDWDAIGAETAKLYSTLQTEYPGGNQPR
jgi:glycosyltransferase involved in cell wall biosynthesis